MKLTVVEIKPEQRTHSVCDVTATFIVVGTNNGAHSVQLLQCQLTTCPMTFLFLLVAGDALPGPRLQDPGCWDHPVAINVRIVHAPCAGMPTEDAAELNRGARISGCPPASAAPG